jgi:hypothetical protein
MTDVFICYARSDLHFARQIAEALRERTTDMFVDLGEWWHDDVGGELASSSEEPTSRCPSGHRFGGRGQLGPPGG